MVPNERLGSQTAHRSRFLLIILVDTKLQVPCTAIKGVITVPPIQEERGADYARLCESTQFFASLACVCEEAPFFARYAFYRYVFFFCPFSQSWSTLLLVLSSRVVPGNVLLFRRFMRLTVSSRCY